MSVNTATVETLTAQVRVLMVGSRQITMSVFRQLDQYERGVVDDFGKVWFEAFGRVRCDGEWVIGRVVKTGALSHISKENWETSVMVSTILVETGYMTNPLVKFDDLPLIVLAGLR